MMLYLIVALAIVAAMCIPLALSIRSLRRHQSPRRALRVNLAAFGLVLLLSVLMPFAVSATEDASAPLTATQTTDSSAANDAAASAAPVQENDSIADGLRYLASALAVGLVLLLSVLMPFAVSATEDASAPQTATQEADSSTANDAAESAAPVQENDSIADGLRYLASALAVGLACLGGGIAVASGAPAAIGATAENPKAFSKSLIFVALGESIALYGLVISILILYS